jgi:hypothetical protein
MLIRKAKATAETRAKYGDSEPKSVQNDGLSLWLKMVMNRLQRMKSVPQRLKPEFKCGACGTAKAVPLRKLIWLRGLERYNEEGSG